MIGKKFSDDEVTYYQGVWSFDLIPDVLNNPLYKFTVPGSKKNKTSQDRICKPEEISAKVLKKVHLAAQDKT